MVSQTFLDIQDVYVKIVVRIRYGVFIFLLSMLIFFIYQFWKKATCLENKYFILLFIGFFWDTWSYLGYFLNQNPCFTVCLEEFPGWYKVPGNPCPAFRTMTDIVGYYTNLFTGIWTLFLTINRFTAIVFWDKHKTIWNKIFIPSIIIILLYPVVFKGLSQWITFDCPYISFSYMYDSCTYYMITIITCGSFALFSTILAIITAAVYRQHFKDKTNQKHERKLIFQAMLTSIFYGCYIGSGAVLKLSNYNDPILYDFELTWLHSSIALTRDFYHLSGYMFLLIFSSTVRELYLKFYHLTWLSKFKISIKKNASVTVNGFHFSSVYENETDGQIYLDVKGIANSTFEEQHELIKLINAILEQSGPQIVVQGDYLPTMIKLLNSKNSTIQIDTLATLLKIANSSMIYAEIILDANAIPPLLQITTHLNDEITSALSFEILKIIIKHDFSTMPESMTSKIASHMSKLVQSDKASTNALNNAIGILTMLCKNVRSPLPLKDINDLVIPAFGKCFRRQNSAPETISFSIASLGWLTLSDKNQQLYFDDEIIKDIFQLANHKNENLQKNSIYVLGNIFSAQKNQQRIEALFDYQIFETFSEMFKNGQPENVLVVANFIRKLFRSSKSFIEPFIKSPAFSSLIEFAENGNDSQNDAHLIVLTATNYGDLRHISLFDQMNVISKMCHIFLKFSIKDQNLFKTSLITYASILQKSEDYKCVILEKLENCGAMEAIVDIEEMHETDDEIATLSKFITSLNHLQKLEGTCSKQF